MFTSFGQYMYALLPTPLKGVGKNQFYILFHVFGSLFDRIKEYIFLLRESSMVISAHNAVLSMHGLDRGLIRLKGETLENYRLRLELYGQVAETAGTNEGIRYLAQSFGYDTVEITPMEDPLKWAEAKVLFVGGAVVLNDHALLIQELDRIKPARTLLHLAKEQRYPSTRYLACGRVTARQTTLRQV